MDHLLSSLLAIPAVGALILFFVPRQWIRTIRGFSLAVLLLELGVSLRLLVAGDFSTSAFQFVENVPWVEALGISYKVGVDGISLWLVLLTTLLTPIALYASWSSIDTKIKEYAINFLLLELGMLGAFVALDLFLFYVFWELMLVPMYLIIGIWGGKNRIYAAVKFFLYTMVGSLLMLVAILYLVSVHHQLTGSYTFDLEQLMQVGLPALPQTLLFAAFALAFMIKVPMFPFHTWLPDAHVQAPTGGSVMLAAVLLKLGTYGFLRFAVPLFPVGAQTLGPTIAVLAVIGILYGAFAAWVQKDLKKLVAYSSVSHMGFVALGIFAATPHAVQGAVIQMISHGVSTGALFLLVGVIYERRHTRQFDDFGGLANVMPWYTLVFVIVSMSSIGLPGTNGFIGEFLVLTGAFFSDGEVGLGPYGRYFSMVATSGVIIAAIYMLHAVLKMFWGPVTHKENEGLADLNAREVWALAPLLVLVFWIGVYPATFLERSAPSVESFVTSYNERFEAQRGLEEPRLMGGAEAHAEAEQQAAVADAAGDVR